jgi:hypothetical protein
MEMGITTFRNAGNGELHITLYLFEDREKIVLFPLGENRLELGEWLVKLFLYGLETIVGLRGEG